MPSDTAAPIEILLARAAAGKTAYLIERVRDAARGLAAAPRVVVPTPLQARAWRRRLAAAGGALGVRILTFDQLYQECLAAAGETYTELAEPVQHRLIRATIQALDETGQLKHYHAIAGHPGFTQAVQELIGELKAARKFHEELQAITQDMDQPERLGELALIYEAYQARLIQQGWADRAGIGWLAVRAMGRPEAQVGRGWGLLVIDGFDSFTTVQIDLLAALGQRVHAMLITLTGTLDAEPRAVHRRYHKTRVLLEQELQVAASALTSGASAGGHVAPALMRLEAGLFTGQAKSEAQSGAHASEGPAALDLIEAPDRAAEVRAALRWLKQRVVLDGMPLDDVALLARDIAPYRAFIVQTAHEFGLPLRLVDGLPLRENPAIVALLAVLDLARALALDAPLGRRALVEAWRNPYCDWSAVPTRAVETPIGIEPGDAGALDAAGRWMRVLQGRAAWEQALAGLAAPEGEAGARDEQRVPASVPRGAVAQALLGKFQRFVQRLTPPDEHSYRGFCGWLEDLIGLDPDAEYARRDAYALNLAARAASVPQDQAALVALKDILRGLVWAETVVPTPRAIQFEEFCADLQGALDGASFQPPAVFAGGALLVASALQARGLPFRAVAVLGLAEGVFPVAIREDPFLRDGDRRALKLDSSTESAEREFFYEAITRPRERLLLTRPRLADNGAEWQASPFWEEARRLVDARVVTLTSDALPAPAEAASWAELLERWAADGAGATDHALAPEAWARIVRAAAVFRQRARGAGQAGAHDGDLHAQADAFAARFASDTMTWSASRLEMYRLCPLAFFTGTVLRLEPPVEPEAGLGARQLGNIYHHIFERVLKDAPEDKRTDLAYLLETLDAVAERVLDEAPRREGFQATAWWAYTRQEILANVRKSLNALHEVAHTFVPTQFEWTFDACRVPGGAGDSFKLKGVIDRIDRAADGQVRIIDYKTAGPDAFTEQSAKEGKKLQIGLYAFAARAALGEIVLSDGFYWHIGAAKASGFRLSTFGVEQAINVAVGFAWEAVRGARAGAFAPDPPADGCPAYCPAATFCWHYKPRPWG